MIREIDLSKYKDPKIELVNGQEKYLDIVSNSHRPITPEERVRQKFVRFMHKKLDIPYEAMLTEESLAHDIKGNLNRMDICVKCETNDGEKLVMVVECKAPHVALTDDVYDQAKKYAIPENIPVIIITNGHEYDCIKRNPDNTYDDIKKLPTYDQLGNYEDIKTVPIEEYSYTRWTYEELQRDDVIRIEKKLSNHFIPDTENEVVFHTLNIVECFFDTSHKVKDLPLKNFVFGKDEGIFKKTVGNPIFDFVSNFRLLQIKDKNENIDHIGFTIVQNSGHPSLYVARYFKNKFHNALELNLDKFMKIDNNHLRFTHNCSINLKNQKLKDFVRTKNLFEEDENEHIILGELNISGLLYCDNPEMNNLMANLIEYAVLRDEYRLMHEADKKKGEI